MPPRYAYWTIIVDEQPTAFRAGAQEELMPTFKRLQQKHPSAKMMWFQNGKLWPSRIDAQEAMRARGEMGRRGDERQAGSGFRDRERRPARDRGARTAWSPRGEPSTPPPARNADEKLDWKPKGEFVPAPKRLARPEGKTAWTPKGPSKPDWKPRGDSTRGGKPAWTPKSKTSVGPPFMGGRGERKDQRDPSTRERSRDGKPSARSGQGKPAWKPKGPSPSSRQARPEWKPRGDEGGKPAWKPKGPSTRSGQARPDWKPRGKEGGAKPSGSKLDWTPKSQAPSPKSPEKRKWVPKEEYKKSLGIEARRDKNWRPGGEHKDPRQKYKDAKKAKWTRFKQTVRKRWEGKQGKKSGK